MKTPRQTAGRKTGREVEPIGDPLGNGRASDALCIVNQGARTMWESIANVQDDNTKPAIYARIEAHGRTEWRTRRTAVKHAREYKADHMRDAWAAEA
jgi:hypothetical protein